MLDVKFSDSLRRNLLFLLALIFAVVLCGCIPKSQTSNPPATLPVRASQGKPEENRNTAYFPWFARMPLPPLQIRGAWLNGYSINSPQAVDFMLERAVSSNLNALFVSVFVSGEAYYNSQLVPRSEKLPSDFDMLAYLIPKAEELGIDIHAWFFMGRIGWPSLAFELEPLLQDHPEWAAYNACGMPGKWLSLSHPEARQFLQALIAEFMQLYDVDGIHLDYIRYAGEGWSFDPYSLNTFEAIYGLDAQALRQPHLPAYAHFTGRPLVGVKTAEVLATFDFGIPAVTLNAFGDGEVVLFNWNTIKGEVQASAMIMQRSLDRLGADAALYLLRVPNTSEGRHINSRTWLRNVGWEPQEISPGEVENLAPEGVIVLSSIYEISSSLAQDLAGFVWEGGNIIFLDGPVHSMHLGKIRSLTGMQMAGDSFSRRATWLEANGSHPLIPTGPSMWDETLAQQWDTYRKNNITQMVQMVRQTLEGQEEVLLTASVFTRWKEAGLVGQDWANWLAQDLIDIAIPMSYAETPSTLYPLIKDWQNFSHLSSVMPGLIVYQESTGNNKSPDQVLEEIELVRAFGIRGIVFFDLEHMDKALIRALVEGPFAPAGYIEP